MQGKIRARAFNWMSLASGLLLLGIGACSGPVSTDNAVVVRSITVTPSLLQEGEVAVVEVLVTNGSGSPLADKTVYLAADPNTGGAFSGSTVTTDADGLATVTFTATNSGTVTISARAEGNPVAMNASVTIERNVATNDNGQIVLTIAPSLMQADGRSTASVLARVSDKAGNAVPDSTVMRFTAGEKFVDVNGDGIWTQNVDSLVYDADGNDRWDPIGTIDPVVYTRNGQGTATYIAGSTSGLVYIKATVGDPGHQVSNDISLSLTSNDSVYSINLTPDWQRIQVRGTGGIEWVNLVATAFDAHGNPAPEGLGIDFNITAGPGGGEAINGDPVGPVTVHTNSLGQAGVTLNSGTIPGTARIRARAGTVVSTATQVTIVSGPPAFLSLGAIECNVPSWEIVNASNKIVAVVADQWGNEVPDSTAVHFGTEQGLIEGAAATQAIMTYRGVAETFWHSGHPKNDGYVYYWCETSGRTVVDTSAFIESGPAASGTFLTWPDTLPANNSAHGEVIIEVLDVNGVFVRANYPIDVNADHGTIGSGVVNDGCHTSVYISEYYAEVLDQDYHYTVPDDGIGAIATIRTRAGGIGGFNGTAEVVLTTGRAYAKNSAIDMQTTLTYGTSTPIEISIKDRNGNPLGGHLIQVTGDGTGGTVTGSPQYTNEYGVASGFTFTATNNGAITAAYMTVTDLDPKYGGITMSGKISLEN